MNVLSLFDGMACGMLAMMGAGVKVDRYVAYEIDKYAVQTASHNFPAIEQRGDVFAADFKEFCGFDYLVGGSPCTYWSIAQKNNRETEASGLGWELFCQYVRALQEAQPKYFIYENNKSMSNAIRQSITQTFGFEPICINSALVSAQNRQRLYWVGKREPDGTYSRVNVDQPEDRGILLRDILDGVFPLATVGGEGKSHALTATYANATPDNTVERHQRPMVAETVCMRYQRSEEAKKCRKQYEAGEVHHGFHELSELHPRPDGKTNTLSTVLKDNPILEPVCVAKPVNTTVEGKAQCIRATCYKDGIRNIGGNDVDKKTGVAEPVYVGELPEHGGKYRNGDQPSQQYRVYSQDGKAVCCDQDPRKWYAIPVEFNGEVPTKARSAADGKIYVVYEVSGGEITLKDMRYKIKLPDGYYIIRKLTLNECKRLQTVPEWFEFPVSTTQAYKMLGNGWTVDVISHLISATKEVPSNTRKAIKVKVRIVKKAVRP